MTSITYGFRAKLLIMMYPNKLIRNDLHDRNTDFNLTGRTFFFYTADRQYSVDSKVTQTEDVSYVSSPYLPECLRRGSHGMTSNAHRAFESAAGKSDIRDEYNEVHHLT